MKTLKNITEAKVGQRISFSYLDGSTLGKIRQVDVAEVLHDRIIGTDVDTQETHQYLRDKAMMIVPVDVDIHLPAEAACEVNPETNSTTRVRHSYISFPDARNLLHQQIDTLNGEDLAEVLAEVQGEDNATFNAANGQVVLERDVLVPHCEPTINLNVPDNTPDNAADIDWVNEDGIRLTTTFFHNRQAVRLYINTTEVSAENLIKEIAQHLGLTIS